MGQRSHIQLQNSLMLGSCVTNKLVLRQDSAVILLGYTLKGSHYNKENLTPYSSTATFEATSCLSLLQLKIEKSSEKKNLKQFSKQK